MKRYTAVFFTICVAALICRGDGKSETKKVLCRTIDTGICILKNKESSDDDKLKAFDKLLTENCHTDLMAMLALGKKGWTNLKPEQRPEFIAAFLNVMTRSYYSKLKQVDLSNVDVDYKENIEVSDSKRTQKTVMKNAGEGFNVDYKFSLRKDSWKIYDLEVEGISLIASYRSQFTDFMKTGSATDLLAELKSNEEKFSAKSVVQ